MSKVEEMALEAYPEQWCSHGEYNPLNQGPQDFNRNARAGYVKGFEKALAVTRAEVERRMLNDYNGEDSEQNEIAQGVCAGILFFIDQQNG